MSADAGDAWAETAAVATQFTPAVSIVMPLARVDGFLDASLASIAAQTLRDFELVVVCDEAALQQVQAALEVHALDFAWRVVATSMRGFAFALNLGIAAAAGEFIARWDGDDLCDAQRLARQVEEMRRRPQLAVLGTRTVLIDDAGSPISFHRFRFYGTDAAIRRALKYRQVLVHSSLMMRRQQLLEWGGYRYGYASEDHAMFLRIARDPTLEFGNLDDVRCYYRRHAGQLSGRHSQFMQFCDIAGFMTTEFLRTGHPLYLVGVLANLPLARDLRRVARACLRFAARVPGYLQRPSP